MGDSLELWRAAKFAVPRLLEHEELLGRIFKTFASSIEFIKTSNSERYHLESLIDLVLEIIQQLPVTVISRYI